MNVDLSTVLCTIDFSSLSPPALRCATDLSRQIGARLVVFHSIPYPRDRFQGAAVFQESEDGHQAAGRAVEKIARLMGEQAPPYKTVVAFGDPVEEIQRVVEQEHACLIVSAIRGLSGFRRILIGTVVERMARTLSQPLLTLRPTRATAGSGTPGAIRLRNVVVGCDLLPGSLPAVAVARELAHRCGAALHVLHTMEAPDDDDLPGAPLGTYTQLQQAQHDRLHQKLAGMLPAADREMQPLAITLATGHPGEALAAYAARNAADLIVVGVVPRHGLEKVLAGSTTEALLRHAPCPVLTVPAGPTAARAV